MKALVKDYAGQQLVYVTVHYKNGNFYDEHENKISYINVLDISRDNRKNTVFCSACGELIDNKPEAIEKHWKAKAKGKDCFTCKYVREHYSRNSGKKTIKPDPNNPGMYIVTTKYPATTLYCSRSWQEPYINTESADRGCVFYECKNAQYTPFTDFFLEYPHAFDTLPTVDMLVSKRWKLTDMRSGYLVYVHPRMTTMEAFVNSKGIVTEFKLNKVHQDYNARFMWSKKYDKMIYMDNRKYFKDMPWYAVHNMSKMNSAIEKVKELF